MTRGCLRRSLQTAAVAPLVLLAACGSSAGAPTPSSSPMETASSAVYGGCADRPLGESLQEWAGRRGAVLRATVRLTGRTTATEDGVYSELAIAGVKTLAGRTSSITAGWVAGGVGPDGQARVTRGTEGALWAPDGSAIVVVNPDSLLSLGTGQTMLQVAPVVDSEVVLSNAGCWSDSNLDTEPFSGQLAEVPGSQTSDAVRQSLRSYPYAELVALAKQALKG